jgi:hypothetical protein
MPKQRPPEAAPDARIVLHFAKRWIAHHQGELTGLPFPPGQTVTRFRYRRKSLS